MSVGPTICFGEERIFVDREGIYSKFATVPKDLGKAPIMRASIQQGACRAYESV